ncbi:MAG TPA: hypothetical protein VGF25_22095 [Thermoleophilaceae bacterium]|jgi:hypothetical protein
MKRILRRRPSPALVVAAVALFLALGGTAYALTITGADVRNGSLTGADIRNRSLTQSDLKGRALKGTLMIKDSVGYNAVKEEVLDASKFKKVKSAEAADSIAGVTPQRIDAFTLTGGESRGVGNVGPLVLTARCRTEGADQVAEIVVQTNQNNSAVDGATKDTDFDIGETVALVAARAATGTPAFDQETAGAAIAPDGTEILGQELYAGTSVLGQANVCRFGGLLYVG